MLDRNTSTPISLQLVAALRELAGELSEGARFPPERELSQRYGVCQSTVAKAVRQLVSEGYVYRIQGKGTFAKKAEEVTRYLGQVLMFLHQPLDAMVHERDYASAELVHGVMDGLGTTADLVLSVMPSEGDERKFFAEKISNPNVNAVVFMNWAELAFMVHSVSNMKKPFVLLNAKRDEMQGMNTIIAREMEGARRAVDYLISLGHRSILFAGHIPSTDKPMDREVNRYLGYRLALENAGLLFDEQMAIRVSRRELDAEITLDRLRTVSGPHGPPTAVFVADDAVAVPFMAKLQAAGRRVPDDVSVMGFDDSPEAATADPPLTTVRKPRREMGRAAARLLLDEMRDGFRLMPRDPLDTSLVVRESCGPVSDAVEHSTASE